MKALYEYNTMIDYNLNPFQQAICVIGESGSGKSSTIKNILLKEEHIFEFIIPTATTTGLLAQYSPNKGMYIPSRFSRLLMKAYEDPDNLYTAVFDEMHKANIIEMINDELLQCISLERNKGRRFISLDDETKSIFDEVNLLEHIHRGNIVLPDNFGIIFITSKQRVILNNPDFFNRVDIVVFGEADRDIDNTEHLLSLKLDTEQKMHLLQTGKK